MKPASSRQITPTLIRATILILILGVRFSVSQSAQGAQFIPPRSFSQCWALVLFPTSPQSSTATQSKKQKLANPLNDLLDDAQRDIDKNDFEAAITLLQKFLAEKPDVGYAHFQLAYAYTALKRVPEARAEYERAIAIDPKMSEAYLNLGMLLTGPEPAAAVAPLRK